MSMRPRANSRAEVVIWPTGRQAIWLSSSSCKEFLVRRAKLPPFGTKAGTVSAESGRSCIPPQPWRFVRSWPKAFKSAIYATVHLLGMQASTHGFEALFDVLA